MGDLFELTSFLFMMYSAIISLVVARSAARVGGPVLVLSLLLFFVLLFHGIHHAFAYLGLESLEVGFEVLASASAVGLAFLHSKTWKR